MGIGTSLGAYFETDLDHHSGNEFVIPPKDTGDDNALPPEEGSYDNKAKVLQVSDIKTASPLITITDEDIEKGMNFGMSFSGGGLSTIRKGPQMRRPANENLPEGHPDRPYNVREPNMIGDDGFDAALEASWKRMSEMSDKAHVVLNEVEKIKAKPNVSEFETAKLGKLDREYREIYPERNIDDALKQRAEMRQAQEESFQKYYKKYQKQTKEERDIERAAILEKLNPGEKVSEEKLYQEMADLLAVKKPSGFELDRISHLNKILNSLEELY